MNAELNIRSTYFPEDRFGINRWFRHICGKDLNLAEIDGNTMIGKTILANYEADPVETVKFIEECAKDNQAMVIRVIGQENFNKLK